MEERLNKILTKLDSDLIELRDDLSNEITEIATTFDGREKNLDLTQYEINEINSKRKQERLIHKILERIDDTIREYK